MGIRNLGCKLLMGGGALTGLLLAWNGLDSIRAQSVNMQETVRAQALPEETRAPRNYLNENTIRLPIVINAGQRGLLKEIHLYVKESAAAPWVLREKVDISRDAFKFKAPRDGEYWFAMVTVDRKGRSVPENVQREGPGLIVVIDTQKPLVELTNLGITSEGQLIRCEVHDANLDLSKQQITFQGGDRVFRTLVPVAGLAGVYCVPSNCLWTGLLRVSASDLAGNRLQHEAYLDQLGGKPVQVKAPVLPEEIRTPVRNSPPPLPLDIHSVPLLPTADLKPVVEKPLSPGISSAAPTPYRLPPTRLRPDGSDGPRFQDNSVQQTNYRAPVKRQIVNSTKVFLDYQTENVGTGGVSKVEIWITKDLAKSWHKLGEDAQRQSPLEINLPGEGLFGVTLVATTNRGVAGAAPVLGDAPDGWIEVDLSKPSAQFTRIDSVREAGLHNVYIQWSVKDANLGDTPVNLMFAASPQGPWLLIAKGLKADGEYRWTPAKEIGVQAHLRLIARDLAGNESAATTLEPVSIGELVRPRVILRGISTGTVAPAPQAVPQQHD